MKKTLFKKMLMMAVLLLATIAYVGIGTAQPVQFLFKFGSFGTGDGQFNFSSAVAVDNSDNIIVVDINNNRVQIFDSSGNFLRKFGSFGSGNGQFNSPRGVGMDSNNRIIVADGFNRRVQVFDSFGNFLFKFGTFGSGPGQFETPLGVAVDSNDRIIVSDFRNHRVQVFDSSGNFQFTFGSPGSGNGQFSVPIFVAVDGSDNILVSDNANHRIQVFDANGNFIRKFGSFGSGNGQFMNVNGVAVDKSGNIIAADNGNKRVQMFDAFGNFLLTFGSPGSGDGQFNPPAGVAVDSKNRIIVCDGGNHRVQVFGTPNQPPVANAGADQNVECTSSNGALVTLDGSGSSDPDGDALTYSWQENSIIIAAATSSPTSQVTLALGNHTIELTVDDGNGGTDTDEVVIDVVDTTPPDVTAAFIAILSPGDDDDGDDHDEDNEDESDRFAVQCSANDVCDANPVITALIEIPSLNGPQVKFKVKNHKKLKIDLKKNKVRVEGPDPAGFWNEVTNAGGIIVTDGQEMTIEVKEGQKYEFKFDDSGNLNQVKAPEVILFCTATDASGNVGMATASLVSEPGDDDDGDDDDDEHDKTVAETANEASLPKGFALLQNYPNPFNPETEIHFQLPEASHVVIRIFNVLGREIRKLTEVKYGAGYHSIRWDGNDNRGKPVSSGLYLYQLKAGDFTEIKKMSLMR